MVSSDTINYGYSVTVSLDTYNCWCGILFGYEFVFIIGRVVLEVLLLLGMTSGLADLFGVKLLCCGLLCGKGELFLNPLSRMVIIGRVTIFGHARMVVIASAAAITSAVAADQTAAVFTDCLFSESEEAS